MKFSELTLEERVQKGIAAAGFEDCMPVQEEVLKYSLSGQDVLVQSQTGSGKTAAFLITILERYLEKANGAKALIIVPTRELAVQIEDDARILSSGIKHFSVASFFGGMGYKKQEEDLKNGVDIIIGTPGRLLDFESSKKIDFRAFDIVVIDEADRLFDMGFFPDIQKMLKKMRPREERQTMLFSATLPVRIQNLAWNFQNNPKSIEIESEQVTVDEIKQSLYHIGQNEKFSLLLGIIRKYEPSNAIIFTNTRQKAVEISKRLEKNGYQAQFMMGDLPQKKRLQIIQRMKKGELRFLAATDVAARGLHVNDLSMVINYDIPEDYENYVHRIGRTARAGKSGLAVSFACEQFVYGLEAIEQYIGMKIPVEPVDESLLVEDAAKHISSRNLTRDEFSSSRGASGRTSGRPSGRSSGKPSGRSSGKSSSGRSPRSTSRSPERKSDRKPDGQGKSTGKAAAAPKAAPESASRAAPKAAAGSSKGEKPSGSSGKGRSGNKNGSRSEGRKPSSASAGKQRSSGGKTPKPKAAAAASGKGRSQNTRKRNSGAQPSAGKKSAENLGPQEKKDYDAIQAMSLEERIAHYKKKYKPDGAGSKNGRQGSERSSDRSSDKSSDKKTQKSRGGERSSGSKGAAAPSGREDQQKNRGGKKRRGILGKLFKKK